MDQEKINDQTQNFGIQNKNFIYEQMDEDFPDGTGQINQQRKSGIGKILSRYRHKAADQQLHAQDKRLVHIGTALNYTQIYQDIQLHAPTKKSSEAAIQPPRSPYQFKSAFELRDGFKPRKIIGIAETPKQKYNELSDVKEQKIERGKYKYRIREFRQSQDRRPYYQQFQPKNNTMMEKYPEQEEQQQTQKEEGVIFEAEKLGKSRSIGVGNYSIHQFEQRIREPQQDPQKMNLNLETPQNQQFKQQFVEAQQQQTNKSIKIEKKQKQKATKSHKKDEKSISENQEEIIVHFERNNDKLEDTPSRGSEIAELEKLKMQDSHQMQEIQQVNHEEEVSEEEENETFSLLDYSKIYPIFKGMQGALKAPKINIQELLRGLKKYLQIVAMGKIDSIDDIDLPLHKRKILKTALFYERVVIIIIAFAYCNQKLQQMHRYLINMVSYGINNSLMMIKVIEESLVGRKQLTKNPTLRKSEKVSMKRNIDSIRNHNDVLLDSALKLAKLDEIFHDNLKPILKLINKSSLSHSFYNLLQYFALYLSISGLDHMIPYLAIAPNPYLQPTLNAKYTLVIDIIEVFCYGSKRSRNYVFRPYCQHFLQEMSQYFEIVSFCSAFPTQIDKIIEIMDPNGYIQHRLYKHHTIQKNKLPIKEVSRIGRPLDQLILLDNQSIGGAGSLENCIHIPAWKGNKNDTVLAELCPLLAMITLKKIRAQEAVSKIRQQSLNNKKQGVKYISFGLSFD